jgi:hypothetical protein
LIEIKLPLPLLGQVGSHEFTPSIFGFYRLIARTVTQFGAQRYRILPRSPVRQPDLRIKRVPHPTRSTLLVHSWRQFLRELIWINCETSTVVNADRQITDDFGQHPQLGGFRSRVVGLGPQLGYLFPIGDLQGYLNLKAYGESRPSGWNTWLTFSISPMAPTAMPPARRPMTK